MKTMYLVVGLALICASAAFASNTATQIVTYEVTAINELTVNNDPAILSVVAATAGSEPNAVTDTTTTYSVTTNQVGKKITGVLNTAMPSGLTLKITLASTGATSAGIKTLTLVTPVDLVTGISKLAETNGITYELSATAAAGVVVSASKTVTLTLTDT